MPDPQSSPSARLTVVEDDDDGAGFVLPAAPAVMRIGRAIENDVVLSDERVSRLHARVKVTAQQCLIEDLGSRTGVAVNGEMIAAPTALRTRDLVRVGGTLFRFDSDQPVAEPPPAATAPRVQLLISTMAESAPQRRGLAAGQYTIGRAGDCDIVLAGKAVSRYHARLLLSADDCRAVNLGSANGTMLNGAPLAASERLRPGDILRIGPYALQLEPFAPAAGDAGGGLGQRVDLQQTTIASASQLQAGGGDHFLIGLSGKARGVRYPLSGDRLTLGAGVDCKPRLAGVPADVGVTLQRDGDGYILTSTSKRVRISGGRQTPCRVVAGDLVEFGGPVFRLIRHGDVFAARFDAAEFAPRRRSRRWLWLLATLILVVAAGFAAWLR